MLIINDSEFICPICESNEYKPLLFRESLDDPIVFYCSECSLVFHNPKNISKINRTNYTQSIDFKVISEDIKTLLSNIKFNTPKVKGSKYSEYICYIIDNTNRKCIESIQ